jgi:hypothetical protein
MGRVMISRYAVTFRDGAEPYRPDALLSPVGLFRPLTPFSPSPFSLCREKGEGQGVG